MFEQYILENGETLETVCAFLGIDKQCLMELNSIEDERQVKPGIMIKVPVVDTGYYDTYTIEKGDSLYAIARKYNINPELLASMNGLSMEDYIYPNQDLLIPKNGYSYYITKAGDTLKTVSSMFKSSIPDILRDNSTIYLSEGQILVHKK